jgi:hypothetical protein
VSKNNEPTRAGAFCPCCSGTGRVSDEHGDCWIDTRCMVCYGTGLNYPSEEYYRPWEALLMRWGWIVVVVGIGALWWGFRA